MRILVPDPCTIHALYGLLAQVFDENGNLRTNAYHFDFGRAASAHPVALIGLNNLLMWLERQGIPYRISGPTHFDGSVLSLQGDVETGEPGPDGSRFEHVLSTRCIDAAGGPAWLRDILSEWIAEKLGVSAFSAASFALHFRHQMALAASFHSELLVQARCASDSWFRLIAASCGSDLPSVMRQILKKPISDLVAMARAAEACDPLVESEHEERCPLHELLYNLVECNLGFVTIHSGFVVFTYAGYAAGLMKKLELSHAFFPGLLIECGLAADSLSPSATFNEPVEQGSSFV